MESVLKELPVYMMIGIIVVAVVSQMNRSLGGILGILFWIIVAVVGTAAYNAGGGIGFPGLQFSQPVFYAFCAGIALVHGWMVYAHERGKRMRRLRTTDDEEIE